MLSKTPYLFGFVLFAIAACSSNTSSPSGDQTAGDGADLKTCAVVADCGVNTGASCARVCQDGSNPCSYACTANKCVSRGCPEDKDAGTGPDSGRKTCAVTSDCGVNPGASCARVCNDGSNPCAFACAANECVPRGCPEDTDGGTL